LNAARNLPVANRFALGAQKSAELPAGGDVTVGSLVGNLSLISSELQSGGDIALNTPNGTLYLGARPPSRLRRSKRSSQFQPSTAWGIRGKDYFEEHISETKSGMGGLMLTSINRGQIDETVVPTLMTANGNLAIVTGDGVIVDYKDTGSLTGSIDQLSQAPGLAWMKQVQSRTDVQWNAIEELHKSWDYRSQGISPVGAALISLAVGWATGPAGFMNNGMGASLFGENLAAAGLSSKTAAVVANAGFSSLVSQAATAIVGNGGDLGAALKQLGSMDTIKALATSMVTAGLIEGLGVSDALSAPTDNLSGSALKMTDFANKLKVGIAQASISATVDSVINGAPLTDNLKNGLVNAAITAVSQTAFKAVGDLGVEFGLKEGGIQKIAMHALTGCAIGQATSSNCTAGAMAAGVQEALGDGFAELTSTPEQQAKLAGMIGALAVAVNGGDATAINTAVQIAETANAFNRQLHPSEEDINRDVATKLAEARGSTPSQELAVVEYITCELIQCQAGPDVIELAPNSPEYRTKIERLYAMYPERMPLIAAIQDNAVSSGAYVPYLYTEFDREMDRLNGLDFGIEPAYPEDLLGIGALARASGKYAVSAIVKTAERLAAIRAGKQTVATNVYSGFTTVESGIIHEANGVLKSPDFRKIIEGYEMKQPVIIKVEGKTIQYEPQLPSSGMTMFGENGFVIGPEAFKSSVEMEKTVLHELHRLKTTVSGNGVSGELASQETQAAFDFAERAQNLIKVD